jgi:hypothetical protein
MITFAPLRALGWKPAPSPRIATRLADPTGDAITLHLRETNLWRFGVEMSLERDGCRLTVRLFLPETNQSDRELGRIEATRIRHALSQALTLNNHAVRFVDAFWQERGKKGWAVLAKAREL